MVKTLQRLHKNRCLTVAKAACDLAAVPVLLLSLGVMLREYTSSVSRLAGPLASREFVRWAVGSVW